MCGQAQQPGGRACWAGPLDMPDMTLPGHTIQGRCAVMRLRPCAPYGVLMVMHRAAATLSLQLQSPSTAISAKGQEAGMLGQTALMLGEYHLQCTAALESLVGNKRHILSRHQRE